MSAHFLWYPSKKNQNSHHIQLYLYHFSLWVPLALEPKRITFWMECFFANIVISRKTRSGRLYISPLAQIFSSDNSITTAPLLLPIFISSRLIQGIIAGDVRTFPDMWYQCSKRQSGCQPGNRTQISKTLYNIYKFTHYHCYFLVKRVYFKALNTRSTKLWTHTHPDITA